MLVDKYSGIWLSHSSISCFKNCPRAYYLSSIYRDPRSNRKISLINPSMALGSAVHEVLESLSVLPTANRFDVSLIARFHKVWEKVTAQKGVFPDPQTADRYKQRGESMLRRVMAHPGPLAEKAVKIKMDLPSYWLSQEDNLILCGKLDWLNFVSTDQDPDTDGYVHIIDFKTGNSEEKADSLQLPIYYLLAHNCQTRPVKQASYWYIARDNLLTPKKLPDLKKSHELVLKIGKEIKLARQLERFKCPEGERGCKHCSPYEKILRGEAIFVGTGEYGADIYVLDDSADHLMSEIL